MNRRDFLASLTALVLAPEERVIRVAHVASEESAIRGARLGAEEAGRTAGLLGARFELSADPDGAVAVVGQAERPGVALLIAGDVFHVSSSPAERRAALARWGGEGGEVVDWHPSLTRFGAEQLNSRFEARFGAPMDSLAWASWLAVKIAAEMALRATPLERLRFDGHKGEPLWFRPEDHTLQQPLYVVSGGKVVAEV